MFSSNKKILVLSGGGTKGICQLGLLHFFEENNYINFSDINVYCGTSVGSIICFLLICGFKPIEIFSYIYNIDSIFENIQIRDFINQEKCIRGFGIVSIDIIEKHIRKIIDSKNNINSCVIDPDITFLELYEKFGIEFIVTGTNITFARIEYFDYVNNPNLKCIDAIKISCCIPFIFQKISYNNCFYSDGGIMDNYPIRYIYEKYSFAKIIGIASISKNNSSDSNIFGYTYSFVNLPIKMLTQLSCKYIQELDFNENVESYTIYVYDVPFLGINMTTEDKMRLFMRGYSEGKFQKNCQNLKLQV